MENKIPEKIKEILAKIETAGFEVYVVGGSVRDLLMGREVKDWDLTTNAKPEEVMQIFSTFANARRTSQLLFMKMILAQWELKLEMKNFP